MNLSSRFPESERSKVKRLPKRGSQERADVYAILDSNILCHIAYVIDGQPFVFIDLGGGKYQLRAVERGSDLENGVEIKQGLAGDESIVTEGSFILKSEVLRAQMGSND